MSHPDSTLWLPPALVPLDVIVSVCGKAYPANKRVLAHHSGYFKALFMQPGAHSGLNVNLPTIPWECFEVLLKGMYSGTWDLTPFNVCHILIYAQLLHIPQAILQCRAFLHLTVPAATASTSSSISPINLTTSSVIKPIPISPVATSKPPLPATIVTSVDSHWEAYQRSLIQSVMPSYTDIFVKPGQVPPVKRPDQDNGIKVKQVQTEDKGHEDEEDEDSHKEKVQEGDKKCHLTEQMTVGEMMSAGRQMVPMNNVISCQPTSSSSYIRKRQDILNPSQPMDIAACDGPVRFHRIVNPISDSKQTHSGSDVHMDDSTLMDTLSSCSSEEDKCKDETILVKGAGRSTTANVDQKKEMKDVPFQCKYCKHIFKSHYCFQKHKRRHINPFNVEAQHMASGTSESGLNEAKYCCSTGDGSPSKTSPAATWAVSEQEEMQLGSGSGHQAGTSRTHNCRDINVQFFPCKICGAKFPSYYFVHKHKKLWHSDQQEATAKHT